MTSSSRPACPYCGDTVDAYTAVTMGERTAQLISYACGRITCQATWTPAGELTSGPVDNRADGRHNHRLPLELPGAPSTAHRLDVLLGDVHTLLAPLLDGRTLSAGPALDDLVERVGDARDELRARDGRIRIGPCRACGRYSDDPGPSVLYFHTDDVCHPCSLVIGGDDTTPGGVAEQAVTRAAEHAGLLEQGHGVWLQQPVMVALHDRLLAVTGAGATVWLGLDQTTTVEVADAVRKAQGR